MYVPLIFSCPTDHVPNWQPRLLLGIVEAQSVNVKNTTFSPCVGCSEGLHAFRFFFEKHLHQVDNAPTLG